jgi:thiol-disulfide isomerase/thioredoxin
MGIRRTSRRRALAAVSLAVGILVGGCTGGSSRPPASPSASSARSLLPATPDALPNFDLATFRQLLGQLEGKPVVVNVWASWCGPCTAEAPHLATVSRETAGQVQFLGVDIIDQRSPAMAFIHRYGWTYPSVFDPTGAIRDGLGFIGQPVTVVFDASGKQVFQWSGAVDEAVLRTELATLGAS